MECFLSNNTTTTCKKFNWQQHYPEKLIFQKYSYIAATCSPCHNKFFPVLVNQGSATYGPRAECGPPRHFTRPVTFYCDPARELFSFFINRYAAINRRNNSDLLAKTFFCGLCHHIGQKKACISGKDLFFDLCHQFGQK